MTQYVLFFRAINVGGKNQLSMKVLKPLLQENGCSDVQTYLQTGNVVFSCQESNRDKLNTNLVELLSEAFGFTPDILLLTPEQLISAYQSCPYIVEAGNTSHFYFCFTAPQLNAEKIAKYQAESEQYQLIDNVFYLHAPDGVGRSKLVKNIDGCLGVQNTGRNLNTVSKLVAMLQS